MKPDQMRLTTLLKDTVILLCKNGLNFQTTLRIEGVLGITIDNSDVFIVHLNESVSDVVETPDIDVLDSSSDREAGTNENSNRVTEKQAVQNSKHNFIKSCKMASTSHQAAMASSNDKAEPTKDVPSLVQNAENVDCNSVESNGQQMDNCIKEESSNDASIGDTALAGTSGNDNDGSVWKSGWAVETAALEETSFRRHKGKKPDAPVPPSGNSEVSGEVFFPNKEIKTEEEDGDWNFDPLAVTNLPAGTDGEAPPWFGFTWNGVSLGTEYHSADPDRVLSQSQVTSNHSYIKRRSLRDDVIYPGMQRQFRPGNVAMLKPFACPVAGCNRRFFHRNNVYRHRKQKHGEGIE